MEEQILESRQAIRLRQLFLFVRLLTAVGLIYFAANLFTVDVDGIFGTAVPDGAVESLNWLGDELRGGAGEEMQSVFPEGFVITHGIYGFAWVNVALRASDSVLKRRALDEARWAEEQIDTPEARLIFGEQQALPNGAFYNGYLNWLRGGILRADSAASAEEKREFQAACAQIATVLKTSNSPYLTSYPELAWPGDAVFLVASLSLHDQLFEPLYKDEIQRWVGAVQARMNPDLAMPPHSADPKTGEPLEPTRGLAAALMVRMLSEIDPAFAREQYGKLRKHFVAAHLGIMPGVVEHRAGTSGAGDVDSGPLVFGFTASGTVLGASAARIQGDRALGEPLFQGLQAAGFPVRGWNSRRYAMGMLPVGDAFLVWAQTTTPWVYSEPQPALGAPVVVSGFRWVWVLLVSGLCLLLVAPELRRRFRRPPEQTD